MLIKAPGSRSPSLAAAMIRSAIIAGADPKFRSDLQARSKASPIAKVAASSNQTFWVGMTVKGTSRKIRAGAQERLSVAEARIRFGDETGYPPERTMTVQYRPPLLLIPA